MVRFDKLLFYAKSSVNYFKTAEIILSAERIIFRVGNNDLAFLMRNNYR